MALCHSPLSILLTSVCFPLSLSLFSVGCHLLQLKRKKTLFVYIHPLLCWILLLLLWMIKALKGRDPVITFFFCFVLFFCLRSFIWEYGFFFSLLPLTHHPAPCIFFFISMSVFGFPIWCWGGRLVEGSDVVSVRTSGGRSQRRERGYKEEVYVEPRLMQLLRIRK